MGYFIAKRRRNFDRLKDNLKDIDNKLILPVACKNSKPSWFGFLMTCKDGLDRNSVVKYIENHGVQTRMLFAGNIIKHPCFDEMRKTNVGYRVINNLNNTDIVINNSFWVGVYPGMTDEIIDYMSKVIKEAILR